MKGRRREQVRRPRVGNHEHVRQLGHVDDLASCGKSATASQVRLENVDLRSFNQLAKTPLRCFLLSAGDERVNAFCNLPVTIVVFGVENFLDKERPKGFERPNYLNGLLWCKFNKPP